MEIVIITGMSGAGKSKVLDVFEDRGYFSMDNLPPQLISKFVEIAKSSNGVEKVCIVVDVRSGEFFKDFLSSVRHLDALNVEYKIIFLDAKDEILINRYKELRRVHPLSSSIVKGIEKEREVLKEVRENANYILDTSNFSLSKLRESVFDILNIDEDKNLKINISSFGFKNGILLDADLVFDVRFLPNPYYISELKNLNGNSEKTRNYVLGFDVTKNFIEKIVELLKFLVPNYVKEGKNSLCIGIGCTGGFHRSVVIANEIGKKIKSLGYVKVSHRDIDK